MQFSIKVHQYVQMNKVQNTGWRKNLLAVADVVLQLRPQYPYQPLSDSESLPGFSAQDAALARTIEARLLGASRRIEVNSADALRQAMQNAKAGDAIILQPGRYEISKRLESRNDGTELEPILLLTRHPGEVILAIKSQEGLYLTHRHWLVQNLIFEGNCSRDQDCEHAIHLYGDADFVRIKNNQFIDFNAAIKSNGNYQSQPYRFPDDVTVSQNDFFNRRVRETTTPASPIDVVGGDDWKVLENFIADFARPVWHKPSVVYGAFFKGGGNHAVIRGNLINCAWKLPLQNTLDVRIGLSLGDGGTEASFCQVKDCQYEHNGGVISENIILNCANDVSIYLNKAQNTQILNNIMLNSLGIDARFPASSAVISGNQLQGRIENRDGAFVQARDNVKVH